MPTTDGPFQMNSLAQALAALAPRLKPADASAALREVMDAWAKATDFPLTQSLDLAKGDLAEALAALAPRVEPEGSAQLTALASRLFLAAMAKTHNPSTLASLAHALAALGPRLAQALMRRPTAAHRWRRWPR